jgi:hypothetical protein
MTRDRENRTIVSSSRTIPLGRIARARSGDKGTGANIGVMVDSQSDFDLLRRELTAERVADFFRPMGVTGVERYELPNLLALNFVVRGILSRGTRVDAQGKALGQAILEMMIPWPGGDDPPTEARVL